MENEQMISKEDREALLKKLCDQDATYETIMVTNAAGEQVPKHFSYGTAGFRTLGVHLEKVLFRVGILIALKAKLTTRIALMVTASHNAAPDNGVKIIESTGSMLD